MNGKRIAADFCKGIIIVAFVLGVLNVTGIKSAHAQEQGSQYRIAVVVIS